MRLMIHPAASQRGDREESVLRPPMRPLRSKVKSGRSVRVKLVLVRSEIPGAQLQGMHGNPKWPVVRGVLDVQNSAFKGDGAERSSRLAGGQARRQQENHAGTKTGHGGDSEYTCEMAHLGAVGRRGAQAAGAAPPAKLLPAAGAGLRSWRRRPRRRVGASPLGAALALAPRAKQSTVLTGNRTNLCPPTSMPCSPLPQNIPNVLE
ncbi:Protein of unknown function [Gryllus bimaculatus]|nr:Protein of unknown function [Gryllus bimaculatus]